MVIQIKYKNLLFLTQFTAFKNNKNKLNVQITEDKVNKLWYIHVIGYFIVSSKFVTLQWDEKIDTVKTYCFTVSKNSRIQTYTNHMITKISIYMYS